MSRKKSPKFHFSRTAEIIGLAIAITFFMIAAIFVSFKLSPWPGALLIRWQFTKNALKTSQALEKYVPSGVSSMQNLVYDSNDPDALLDVYFPQPLDGTSQKLPTIVWVHGGAWVSGNKDQVANYLKILAARGYTTVSVNYSIAPGHHYPTPLNQANSALRYLDQNAHNLHIDNQKFILAGDSAGAQIAAQAATVLTNPLYAERVKVSPAIKSDQLRAVILACGAYDLNLVDLTGPYAEFLQTVLWSYSGSKNFLEDPEFRLLSITDFVTNEFPPAFITAGNGDPLETHSLVLAEKLRQNAVKTDTLFYPANHEPVLPHEYQFNLDTPDGTNALQQIFAFLDEQVSSVESHKLSE